MTKRLSPKAAGRPVLLIDVDGVLNPFAREGAVPAGWESHQVQATNPIRGTRTYTVVLTREHGAWLTELARDFDLAWATTWEDQANTVIAPLIGLPARLPVAEVGWRMYNYDKVEGIVALVGDRPAAWIDDEPGWAGNEWAKERRARGVPTLLLVPNQKVGLTRAHVEALQAFAASLHG